MTLLLAVNEIQVATASFLRIVVFQMAIVLFFVFVAIQVAMVSFVIIIVFQIYHDFTLNNYWDSNSNGFITTIHKYLHNSKLLQMHKI